MKRLLLLLFLLCTPTLTQADEILGYALGANGVWYDDDARPADFEFGGNARASFSPHLSGVGAAYYGVDNSYLRGSAGVRVTATDVNNPNFSVGIGYQYHVSSEADIRPEGWAPDVSLGWRAWPNNLPRVILVAQATYFSDFNQVAAIAGFRYQLGGY